MSSALVIRIIGGVCGGAIGTYISGKIYDYLNKKDKPLLKNTSEVETELYNKTVIQDEITFEDILNKEIKEQLERASKYNYEYDNEHGNTVDIKIVEEETVKECTFINDAIYDGTYLDCYSLLFSSLNDKKNG